MTRKVVDGGVDGNPMVHSPFQDDHPNRILRKQSPSGEIHGP